tara:strand:- start:411 stop:686 length:276 start_codon:yes stop_codon:yes gene_type:complete
MRISQIVESGDIYPALCDLAGIPEPDGLAGENLANHIINKDIEGKTYAFSQFLRYCIWSASKGKETMGYSVRTEDWRYVEWFESDKIEVVG